MLAPPHAVLPPSFHDIRRDPVSHDRLLAAMQRLRGRIYLEDGAIDPHQLSIDGRHCQTIDRDSWHLLAVDASRKVCGCVRYYAHTRACFTELWVRNSAIASSATWGRKFRSAVETELHQAYCRNLSYVEVGGWAIPAERRSTADALRIALATYCLAQILGGCLGITTATVRHNSSSILRRIGGSSLQLEGGALPPYYDPHYQCEMEVLRFDSGCPAPRYSRLVDELRAEIVEVPVVCPSPVRVEWSGAPVGEPISAIPSRADYAVQDVS